MRALSCELVAPHEVQKIVARLRAAFPDPPMTAETEALYSRLLGDLEYAEVDGAVDDLIVTTMRLPTISRIRRAVIEPILDIPSTEEAWVALQSRASDVHPLVSRAARLMGGSFNLRTSSDPELTRVRFAKVYDELRRQAVDSALIVTARARRMKLVEVS
jgi:hypothetical protein